MLSQANDKTDVFHFIMQVYKYLLDNFLYFILGLSVAPTSYFVPTQVLIFLKNITFQTFTKVSVNKKKDPNCERKEGYKLKIKIEWELIEYENEMGSFQQ